MKKKILIVVIIITILLITFLLLIIYPSIINNKYEKEVLKDIYNNTNIEEINYINKDNNYYIIISNSQVIVLDLNYEEVYSLDKSALSGSDLPLVYLRNNLYYKEKIRKKNKLIYNFYNANDLSLAFSTQVGGY